MTTKLAGIRYEYIDAEIRELVKALRDAGYNTTECCAGHLPSNTDRPVITYGWITFDFPYQLEPLLQIFRKFGMTDLRVMVREPLVDGYNFEVRFTPVGKRIVWADEDLMLDDYLRENSRPYFVAPTPSSYDWGTMREVYHDN